MALFGTLVLRRTNDFNTEPEGLRYEGVQWVRLHQDKIR